MRDSKYISKIDINRFVFAVVTENDFERRFFIGFDAWDFTTSQLENSWRVQNPILSIDKILFKILTVKVYFN